MDLYFARHDGQAVTTEDFVKAMEDANAIDLKQFRLWYTQAGTPLLDVRGAYDRDTKTFTLTVTQSCPSTPGQTEKKPFHIPFALGLLDPRGNDIALQLENHSCLPSTTKILNVTEAEHNFRLVNISDTPVPSLLRNFSSPARVQYQYSDQDLTFLMAHDSDAFNRWEAGQRLALRIMLALISQYQTGKP